MKLNGVIDGDTTDNNLKDGYLTNNGRELECANHRTDGTNGAAYPALSAIYVVAAAFSQLRYTTNGG